MLPKNILVTGAGRGIGRAIATVLADQNKLGCDYRLILIDKDFPPEFDGFIKSLEDKKTAHLVLQIDVSKENERQWLLTEMEQTFKTLDGIVHNAAVFEKVKLTELTSEHYDQTQEVNLRSAVFLTKELLPILQKDSSIVMVSSIRAYTGARHALDYVISKSGMIGAMRALAVELSPTIRVNAVAPASIDTAMIEGDSKLERRKRTDQILLGRLGSPEEAAFAVEFLLSEKSSYITGQVIHVNGGSYFG